MMLKLVLVLSLLLLMGSSSLLDVYSALFSIICISEQIFWILFIFGYAKIGLAFLLISLADVFA